MDTVSRPAARQNRLAPHRAQEAPRALVGLVPGQAAILGQHEVGSGACGIRAHVAVAAPTAAAVTDDDVAQLAAHDVADVAAQAAAFMTLLGHGDDIL